MKYEIYLTSIAEDDAKYFERSGQKLIQRKIVELLNDISSNPYSGIGKPERLRNELSGCISRRINKEHRLVYSVDEDNRSVTVLSLRGHYMK